MKEILLGTAAVIALLAPVRLTAESEVTNRTDTGFVTAIKIPTLQEKIAIMGNSLLINGKTIGAPSKVRLVDDNAIPAVAKLYAYLDASRAVSRAQTESMPGQSPRTCLRHSAKSAIKVNVPK